MWYDDLFPKARAKKTRVAARLITATGSIYYGVNVESSCHTLSVCAERVAIFNAVLSEGPDLKIRSIDVHALKEGELIDIIPCGGCRQLASEFAVDSTVVCDRLLSEWLPNPYL